LIIYSKQQRAFPLALISQNNIYCRDDKTYTDDSGAATIPMSILFPSPTATVRAKRDKSRHDYTTSLKKKKLHSSIDSPKISMKKAHKIHGSLPDARTCKTKRSRKKGKRKENYRDYYYNEVTYQKKRNQKVEPHQEFTNNRRSLRCLFLLLLLLLPCYLNDGRKSAPTATA